MPGGVRQWTLAALVKRRPCTSTVWRQLTDWRERVAAWRDLRGLLYSHSSVVCLLIQLKRTKMQPSMYILTRAAWFFDCLYFTGHDGITTDVTAYLFSGLWFQSLSQQCRNEALQHVCSFWPCFYWLNLLQRPSGNPRSMAVSLGSVGVRPVIWICYPNEVVCTLLKF
jgi:hypothetical protein